MRWKLLSVLMILALVAVACGDDDATTTSSSGPAAASCELADLNLFTDGQLTVATGEPAFPPWVGTPTGDNFDEPESGVGFESAVVYSLAAEMGFTADQVVWVRTGFDEAISGPKNFDFNVQQYTITAERDEIVDFSDPYYSNAQALVAFPDNEIASATSMDDLADFHFGVQVGTTSLDYVEQVIDPNTEVAVYDTTVLSKSALEADQIDGLVVDIATAYYITAVEIPGSIVVAAFGVPADSPDEFGLLFEEGNSLRDCVNVALAALRADGTLALLEEQWLVDAGGAITISE